MRLSDTQRRVLAHLELAPETPAPTLAKRLRLQEHTVRYALDRLLADGIIVHRPFVDIFKVVRLDVGVFLGLAIGSASKFRALGECLAREPRVSFLETAAGEFHLHFAMHADRLQDVLDLLDLTERSSNGAVITRAVIPRVRYYQYRHKCIGDITGAEPVLQAGETEQILDLTPEERKILNHLASGWSGSLRQAARDLSMPFSTFEGRVQRLKAQGVLAGAFYDINLPAIGLQSFKLLLYCRNSRPQFEKRLELFCRGHRLITYLAVTIGQWDFEVGVATAAPSEIPLLIGELHETFAAELLKVSALSGGEVLKFSFFPSTVSSASLQEATSPSVGKSSPGKK